MGPCECTRAWRLPGGAGAFWVGIGLLLLMGLSLVQATSSPQAACPANVAPQRLAQPEYQHSTGGDNGAGFMADLVQSFLHTVQPNPFPKDLILKLVEHDVRSDPDVIKESLLYEVGFLVCAAIGVLYIVLMPIVGFFLACCRCCGNCGGRMYQEQTSRIHCCRRALYWSAFITTLIILAGNICMFRSNEALREGVEKSSGEIDITFDNLQTYLTAVPQQFDRVVNESFKTTQEVSQNLHDIGPQLGTEIQNAFTRTLDPALSSVRLMEQETSSTADLLTELSSSLARLQSSLDLLQANVSATKTRINQTLHKTSCIGCTFLEPELEKLTVDISVTVPGLSEFQAAVDEVIQADLNSQIKEVEDYFNSIPQRVTNATKDVVQSTMQQLEEIQAQVSQISKDLPLSALTDVSHTLDQLQADIISANPQVKRAEYIRWAVCVTLCCVVLLVVVCNVLGLLLGPVGLEPKADPTERSCSAHCGGTFLMMGAGFSFLVSWLFMLVVLVLFLLGGNVYTLLCRPWANGELLEFLDTPGLIPELELGPKLGLKSKLTITDIYRDCEKNMPLWSTLHLYELVDLEDLLNVSKYTAEIQQHFENTNISLPRITFLTPDVKQQLRSFSAQANGVDFNNVTQQINNGYSINLTTTADELDELADNQPNPAIETELRGHAMEVRQIQINIETSIHPQLEKLSSNIQSLRSVTGRTNGTVGEVLSKVGAAQDFFDTNSSQSVRTEIREFLDCQMAYFIAYADWANLTITQQLGRCGPVAGAVDSAEVIVCSHLVESLNAFWFSLGWCLIFFIPSIIFTIKLAKYYRRMDQSDVFEHHIMMNDIPRAQMKVY